MAFRHGKDTAIFIDTLNASPYFNAADVSRTLAAYDVTGFGSQARNYIPGIEDATFSASGFFDGAVGLIDDRLWALQTAAVVHTVTYCPDGGAKVGRMARLIKVIDTEVSSSTPVTNAVTLKMSGGVSGGAEWGKVLADTTPQSTTTTGPNVDWGTAGASTNGGVLNIHVIANTRSTTTAVKAQHSTDGTTFVDLAGAAQTVPIGAAVTGTAPFGAPQAYSLTVTGSVNRYLRLVVTPTAGTGSITVVAAFARF